MVTGSKARHNNIMLLFCLVMHKNPSKPPSVYHIIDTVLFDCAHFMQNLSVVSHHNFNQLDENITILCQINLFAIVNENQRANAKHP